MASATLSPWTISRFSNKSKSYSNGISDWVSHFFSAFLVCALCTEVLYGKFSQMLHFHLCTPLKSFLFHPMPEQVFSSRLLGFNFGYALSCVLRNVRLMSPEIVKSSWSARSLRIRSREWVNFCSTDFDVSLAWPLQTLLRFFRTVFFEPMTTSKSRLSENFRSIKRTKTKQFCSQFDYPYWIRWTGRSMLNAFAHLIPFDPQSLVPVLANLIPLVFKPILT